MSNRRSTPPSVRMAVDVVRFAWITRSWMMLAVIVVGLVALALGIAVQVVVPWAIYPFV